MVVKCLGTGRFFTAEPPGSVCVPLVLNSLDFLDLACVSSPRLGKFSVIISSHKICTPFSLSSFQEPCNMNVGPLDILHIRFAPLSLSPPSRSPVI